MNNTAYLGMDIGSISTKGVVIDQERRILGQDYLWTRANPIAAVKELLASLQSQLDQDINIISVGATGSARKLIGAMTGAQVVKNEITAHAVGTLSRYPQVRTIVEIGGQDSKIILIEDGIVIDYAMNSLCAAGTGAFLSSQAERLGVELEDIGNFALQAENPVKLAARCTVFAESDLIHKAQSGHKKEDLLAGLCAAVVGNYLNNVGKGKKIQPPVFFQGGVSKNIGVTKALEEALGHPVQIDENSHLMGALGAAVLAMDCKEQAGFDFEIARMDFNTKSQECGRCPNNCELVSFYRDGDLLDIWGNRCPKALFERNAEF